MEGMGGVDMARSVKHLSPQLALVVSAAVILLVAMFTPQRRHRLCASLALVAVTVSAALQLVVLGQGEQLTFGGLWALDGVSAWATVAVLVTTALAIALAPEWLATDRRHGEWYALVLLSALGASMLAGAADLMQLVIAVVLASVTGYVLAAYHRRSALSVEAGIKYFLIGGLTNTLLLLGAVLLYGVTGTTVYADIAVAAGAADTTVLMVAVALLGVGLAFELGAVPAHAWVPDVAEGSPVPSAAFLTVAPKLGTLVAIARLVTLLPAEQVGWRPLVAVLAAVTMTLGNAAALPQDDVRRLLGWSSVSQAGYGLMALVALGRTPDAVPALLYFLFAYAVANVAAFGVVAELRGRTALDDYAGLGRSRPWLAAAMTVSLLSLTGIPPLTGFAAKLNLFAVTIDAGYAWLAVLAVANTVVSLFYYLRVVGPMYLEAAPGPVPVLGRWAATAVTASTTAIVALGLFADPLLNRFVPAQLLP